jgi:uncharacterized protein (UPF0335 family)
MDVRVLVGCWARRPSRELNFRSARDIAPQDSSLIQNTTERTGNHPAAEVERHRATPATGSFQGLSTGHRECGLEICSVYPSSLTRRLPEQNLSKTDIFLRITNTADGGLPTMTMHQQAQEHLRQFIEQIERLEEEKKAIADDIKDKFAEAKAVGFDVKALRKIIALRKKSQDELSEEEAILATYLHALGMADAYDEPVLEAAE